MNVQSKPFGILRKIFPLLLGLIWQVTAIAQWEGRVNIQWHTDTRTSADTLDLRVMPLFSGGNPVYDGKMWWLENSIPDVAAGDVEIRVKNIRYSPADDEMLQYFYLEEKTGFTPVASVYKSRDKTGIYWKINVFSFQNGRWYKLDAFDYEIRHTSPSGRRPTLLSPVHGPLSHGKWYRIEVDKTGIYKIDKNFLEDLGINVSDIDPRNLKIYGWGGRMLPLLITPEHNDFIPETAIEVVGEEDGRFDDGDYILFYAVGKQKWNREYQTHNNIYSRHAYYYLVVDDTPGKRITVLDEPDSDPLLVLDHYFSTVFYEKDSLNLVHLGREWYGPDFNGNPLELRFDLGNVDFNYPLSYRYKAATINKMPGKLILSINGQKVDTLYFPALTPTYEQLGIRAIKRQLVGSTPLSSSQIEVRLTYDDGGYPLAKIHLDYLILHTYNFLAVDNASFAFEHPDQKYAPGPVEYRLTRTSQLKSIWKVTDPLNVQKIEVPAGTENFRFKDEPGSHTYFTVTNRYLTPVIPEDYKVENQDLAYSSFFNQNNQPIEPVYLIIAPENWKTQAMRYVEFHSQRGIAAIYGPLEKIYLEFGNGMQDVSAIRNYIHYLYHASGKKLKYVVLLGDASWDYMKRQFPDLEENFNVIPSYQSQESMSLSASFVTDDFFVCVDENEGIMEYGASVPDVAIGRIPVSTDIQVDEITNKLLHYYDPETFGAWHNNITLISDDADGRYNTWELNLLRTTIYISALIEREQPFLNQNKIFFDAYPQVSTAGGDRYPDVHRDILNSFENGTVILNYIGHGNEYSWAHERVLNLPEIRSLRNEDKLPFVSTLTCEFGRYDNPVLYSGAELFILNPRGGAFQMITTTREVNAGNAIEMNKKLYIHLLRLHDTMSDKTPLPPGEALMCAKQNFTSINNKISLFGDPAMPLNIGKPRLLITQIEGAPGDTIKALQKITVKGKVVDEHNNWLSDFNGTLQPVVFDKKVVKQTLNNDNVPGQTVTFEALGPVIFRGQTRITDGQFEFQFVVPKDIKPQYDYGRFSLYGFRSQDIRQGVDTSKIIGGVDTTAAEDHTPPEIKLYLNDYTFADGGITDPNPFLLVKLSDENGINTVGGVGHDIVAELDGSAETTFLLNDYYTADENTYRSGTIRFKLYGLEPGEHVIKVKAWDTYNNPGEAELHFRVVDDKDFEISRVLNYPNPFIDYTEFWFSHNRPYEPLDVQVQVYSVSGKLVWSTYTQVITEGNTARDIRWDGRDMFGRKIGKGVYFYKLSVRTQDGQTAEKWEKLTKL